MPSNEAFDFNSNIIENTNNLSDDPSWNIGSLIS